MSPEQTRAARAWLDWTQQELAARANVGLSTVKAFEKGGKPIANNLAAIERAIQDAGIHAVDTPDGAPLGITKNGMK
jgi:DNA-binding transcriptional regulator YiaG